MGSNLHDLQYRTIWHYDSDAIAKSVSVVIPLYNYESYIIEALESIRAQTLSGIALIVVDDLSTDRSLRVAQKWMEQNAGSFAHVTLAQNVRNSGLPYTRNVGFSIAQTDAVFPIDADNTIYPRCLDRCLETMLRYECAVVYTIIERFGTDHSLINLAQWGRDTFRHGNQIDAMALISREAWIKVGGYDAGMRLGWEDYELWLRFCDAGLSGRQVPEILGRYRVHSQSMTQTVTSKRHALIGLARQLQARYPWTSLVPSDEDQLDLVRDVIGTSESGHQIPGSTAVERPTPPGMAMSVPFKFLPRPPTLTTPTVAAIIHAHYPEVMAELCAYLQNLPPSTSIFVSTDSASKGAQIAETLAHWQVDAAEIRVLPNRGRDIAPKLFGFADVYTRHEFVVHLHTKRSPHLHDGVSWRHFLLEHLLGSPLIVNNIIVSMQLRSDLGMIFPQHWEPIRPWVHWGGNFAAAQDLAKRIGIQLPDPLAPDFPSGSMFWARSLALRPILDLGLTLEDFPPELGQTDCTLAHAIERLYAICCEWAGFRWAKIAVPRLYRDQRGNLEITSVADLDWFVCQLTNRMLREGSS